MNKVKIARIAVAAATYLIDKPYDYAVPESLAEHLERGMRVLVPFGRGNRISEGIVLSTEETERMDSGVKTVLSLLDTEAVLSQSQIRLALWMRDRYFCTMYDAVRTILPAGLWFHTYVEYILCNPSDKETSYRCAEEIPEGPAILDLLYANNGCIEEEKLKELCAAKEMHAIRLLCDAGIIEKRAEAVRQIRDAKMKKVALAVSAEEAMAAVENKRKSAPLRYEVIRLLSTVGVASQSEICYFTGATASTIASLKKSGLIEVWEEEKIRVDVKGESVHSGEEIRLNDEQQAAYQKITALLEKELPAAALLHGVTGSGKTQVYIRLVQDVIARGKTAIVLVPEIALTPQMMSQFAAYFGNQVAMLHSALRMSELYDQWKRIRRGEVKLVLGTRSAIFAPLCNIGIIILDEEQETSYQSENPPRYHAKEIAKYLCGEHNAVFLLGSATPSIESAYEAKSGIYEYVQMRHRYNQRALPAVLFADMKEEIKRGNNSCISEKLRSELQKNIQNGEQSILLLNRRGNSRMLLCGECGHVPECPRCSVPLTYHSANERLMCHYCGHSEHAKESCSECGGLMKYVGTGTQKAEEELKAMFPGTEILRMDADTVSVRGGHEKILSEFAKKEVPILLGTQMVAKGLDFENVTLVGVLCADSSLYVDHYCAAERTFSLLTQVIGRAGRGEKSGRAVIQTYTPENEVLLCAAEQNYDRFYDSEIRMRKLHAYPPFSDLFTLVVSGAEENRVLRASALLRDAMRFVLKEGTYQGEEIGVVGPAPAPIAKVNNRYRYHIYLVAKNCKTVREFIEHYLKEFSKNRENRGLNIFVNCNAAD